MDQENSALKTKLGEKEKELSEATDTIKRLSRELQTATELNQKNSEEMRRMREEYEDT